MAYEIDFLRVGDKSKGGDAIAMRWGDNLEPHSGDQVVVVVDGGNKAAGEELVAHLKKFCGTRIDYLISSHPHDDHQTGLTVLLDDGDFDIGRLWMHLPWNHTSRASLQFRDGRVTPGSVSERLELSLNTAKDIQVQAEARGIPIEEPFAGKCISFAQAQLWVAGPSEEYYENELLPHFDSTPETASGVAAPIRRAAAEVMRRIRETISEEKLTDDGWTSAENNSSTVLFFDYHDEERDDRVLLTADAGIGALERSADFLEGAGGISRPPFPVTKLQLPHHGSKQNVGPSILNRLTVTWNGGERLPDTWRAYISCPRESNKHPSGQVANAADRRGGPVYLTQGQSLRTHHNAPDREGWVAAKPVGFMSEYDDD